MVIDRRLVPMNTSNHSPIEEFHPSRSVALTATKWYPSPTPVSSEGPPPVTFTHSPPSSCISTFIRPIPASVAFQAMLTLELEYQAGNGPTSTVGAVRSNPNVTFLTAKLPARSTAFTLSVCQPSVSLISEEPAMPTSHQSEPSRLSQCVTTEVSLSADIQVTIRLCSPLHVPSAGEVMASDGGVRSSATLWETRGRRSRALEAPSMG